MAMSFVNGNDFRLQVEWKGRGGKTEQVKVTQRYRGGSTEREEGMRRFRDSKPGCIQ